MSPDENYLCDVVCWIPSSTLHQFKWDCSCFELVAIVTSVHLNLSTSGQSLYKCLRVPWMEIKSEFRDPEKVSCPFNRGNKYKYDYYFLKLLYFFLEVDL